MRRIGSVMMETEGACALFGPLTLPVPTRKIDQFHFAPWEVSTCHCVLCDVQFELPKDNDFLLAHLYTSHKLVIADAHLLPSLKGYLDYWKVRFSQQPITDFCTTMVMDNQNYYLLSDAHPEDNQLRRGLLNKRLEWILDYQRKEREDRSFIKSCFFCRHVEKGSRSDFLTHLSYHHNFQLGRPDNLVFIDKLLEKVEEKLNRLECIYCEHMFKDRTVLKEHMRKKFHKRINPKNKEYDPFFVINYLQEDREEESKDKTEDSWSQWREEGSDWSDWQEDPTPIVCLFCTHTCGEWEDILKHMSEEHGFSYKLLMGCYNFYEQVKIVNYIRREVHLFRCHNCNVRFQSREELLEHMSHLRHFTLPARENWDHPEFFFSTYENDSFLCLLEDNEEDPLDQLSTQMLSHCSLETKAAMD
ncbi:UNVERIFIED_CONTAM: hypothetical protein PYX00_005084 [Menopon gallinae]|uniref:C2H2-type domain-containing protein n=1 Tax=Menopon gallinae TaxID=328185 RepID=A0AAW2HRF7_9NEOP